MLLATDSVVVGQLYQEVATWTKKTCGIPCAFREISNTLFWLGLWWPFMVMFIFKCLQILLQNFTWLYTGSMKILARSLPGSRYITDWILEPGLVSHLRSHLVQRMGLIEFTQVLQSIYTLHQVESIFFLLQKHSSEMVHIHKSCSYNWKYLPHFEEFTIAHENPV